MAWEGSDAPVWGAKRLRIAADAAGVGLWSWNADADADVIAMDDRGHALRGCRGTARSLSPTFPPASNADGTVEVSCPEHDGAVAVVQAERGGPPLSAPKGPGGFGGKPDARSLSQQLGGSNVCDRLLEGAVVTLRMSRARSAA